MNVKQAIYLFFWYVVVTIGVWIFVEEPLHLVFLATMLMVVVLIAIGFISNYAVEFYDSLDDQTLRRSE